VRSLSDRNRGGAARNAARTNDLDCRRSVELPGDGYHGHGMWLSAEQRPLPIRRSRHLSIIWWDWTGPCQHLPWAWPALITLSVKAGQPHRDTTTRTAACTNCRSAALLPNLRAGQRECTTVNHGYSKLQVRGCEAGTAQIPKLIVPGLTARPPLPCRSGRSRTCERIVPVAPMQRRHLVRCRVRAKWLAAAAGGTTTSSSTW
jgi:hypothetical protein